MKYCPKCSAEYSDDQAFCPIDAAQLVEKVSSRRSEEKKDPFLGFTIAEKYRIERLIGRGGMGAVYEGHHVLLERPVAIKVLHKNMSADERATARFLREAKASAKIEHPNGVTIHDFGVLQDGSAYLVMEFIRGFSLRHLLMNKKKIEIEQAIEWVSQVCGVVEVAHQQGIIHRDLKPENVMLKESPDGSLLVKVVDFGLAKLVSGEGEGSKTNLTQTGEVLGTPHYMAPEYYEGEQIDRRADIYAIGVLLYEMLTGDTPFSGTVQSIIGGHLFKDPKPLFSADPSIHPQINEVVQNALKKKRDERIGSAAEFAQQLKAAYQETYKSAGQQSTPTVIPAISIKPEASVASSLVVTASESGSTPQPAVAKVSSKDRPTELMEDSPRGHTGMITPGNSTGQLDDSSVRDSLKMTKRQTQQVFYDTVAMANKPKLENATSRPIEAVMPAVQLAGEAHNWQTGVGYATQPIGLREEEPETFIELIISMKRELAIGALIVTVLAIALVIFIIYSQRSPITVKPLPDVPANQSTSRP
ncbi:MAG: serine/threonine-protein kinase [Acidobacteriota bacterium]